MAGPALRLSALAIASVNGLGFAATALTQSHALTDLCGTAGFVAGAWATHGAACRAAGRRLLAPTRGLALTLAVSAWAARLGGHLFARVLKTGKDERLDPLFGSPYPLKLAGFWCAQAAWAWIGLLPVVAVHARPATKIGAFSGAALAAAAAALGVEAAADAQKSAFRADPANAGKHCDAGLFAVVQHPNYSAEIAFWSALTLAAGPATLAAAPWALASPSFSYFLITRVSGIPPLRERSARVYGRAWADYDARTPRLLPRGAGGRARGE